MSEESKLSKRKSPRKILAYIILLVVFIGGAYTTTTYFFSFIGLIIGLIYFLLVPNRQMKRLGALLSWTIGITSIIKISWLFLTIS